MIVSLIVAMGSDHAIGRDNDLMWHLPADMKFFKETTRGHHVLMGRKNYLSIPERFRPLPGRPNQVLTRQQDFEAPGCTVIHNIEEGIDLARQAGEEELFVIGGGEVYALALKQGLIDKMYITHVQASFEDAEAFFPKFEQDDWNANLIQKQDPDDKHQFAFEVWEYKKKG
ncbi:dihydrofolate reductase [bacterium SCSIO 12741]|nr:dihydrofolate reductase [bacterium SCSIO 12741]